MYKINESDIVKVCLLYYQENKTHEEISRLMGISRFKISRLLRQAKKEGVISIRINDPMGNIGETEIRLAKKFRLKEAVIVRRSQLVGKTELAQIGETGARYLTRIIDKIKVLSVAWGITLRHVVNSIEAIKTEDLTVVQLTGSMGVIGGTDTNMLTMMLSEKLSAKSLLLQAPLLVRDEKTKNAFLREGKIAETLAMAKTADMALLGIGLANQEGTLYKTGLLRGKDYDEAAEKGAVGALCGRLYDINGKPCIVDWDKRVIGLTLEELSKVKHKVGIAGGHEKMDAIVGALRGRFLDVLITDENTAQSLLGVTQDSVRPK